KANGPILHEYLPETRPAAGVPACLATHPGRPRRREGGEPSRVEPSRLPVAEIGNIQTASSFTVGREHQLTAVRGPARILITPPRHDQSRLASIGIHEPDIESSAGARDQRDAIAAR